MAKNSNNDTFIRITNNDIFSIITDLKEINTKQHNEMLVHQKYTNGKVKLNMFTSRLSLGLALTSIVGLAGLKFIGVF